MQDKRILFEVLGIGVLGIGVLAIEVLGICGLISQIQYYHSKKV